MSALSESFANALLTQAGRWDTGTLHVYLVDLSYAFNPATPAIPTLSQRIGDGPLTGATVSGRWARADPVWIANAETSRTIHGLVVTQDAAPILFSNNSLKFPFQAPRASFWLEWAGWGVFSL